MARVKKDMHRLESPRVLEIRIHRNNTLVSY
jgi:hypothetical protein